VPKPWKVIPRRKCWEWTRDFDEWGCPTLQFGEVRKKADYIVYQLYRRPIPAISALIHRCGNEKCVNPAHMIVQEGKRYISKGVGRAKLSIEDIARMKKRYKSGEVTQFQLGEEFGVCRSIVQQIVGQPRDRFGEVKTPFGEDGILQSPVRRRSRDG
jgi:hypothetical protein